MNSAPHTRSAGIDAVRVFGIAAVIFGHVYTGPATHQFIYAWHVPLFFFITGYLWTRNRPIRRELATRGRTLGLPYVSWFVLLTLLLMLDALGSGRILPWETFISPALGGSNARGAYGTFWFVSVLFFTTILYRLIERLPRPLVWTIAGLGLISGYVFGDLLASTPLAFGSAFPCLFFLVAGTTARRLEAAIHHRTLQGAALIVVPLLAIAVLDPSEIDIKQGLYGAPVLGVVCAAAISFGLVLVAKSLSYPKALAAIITEFAIVGITVVLAHPFVLGHGRALGMPSITVLLAALLVPWAAALLIHRTPASSVLIGAPRRSRRTDDGAS